MNFGTAARALLITSISAVALSGCAGGAVVNPLAPAEPEPVYVTAPLTGVQYEETTPAALQLKKPSVACKIDNGSEAPRPQSGLNSTDIVFDEMVEGGLTRLVAIWHSTQPDAIGPVRSIRPMDPDILSPFGGIVCFSGGQAVFVNMINQAPVFVASETTEQGKGTFSRSSERVAPHNVIVNVQKLAADHPELAPPVEQFKFAKDVQTSSAGASGAAVTKFEVKFPQASALWTPSNDGAKWLRTQDGQPLTDKLDGAQVAATNIVVLQVRVDRSYLDRKYGNVPKTVMVDTGKAWVFTGGKYVEATWSKASATSPIVLTDAAGAPVLLAPGNTWVELMPVAPEGKINITAAPVASPSPSPSAKK
ncbi:DUF3048 domain-containing protein [Rhodoluna lacicola]|uniref:DUF3048 domain-containing protein n=1 Tax=Rhodoluna lacicola TaxID=529884 RepID=UPI00222E4637|nr:DUF3048 domain-containing protein [Rhodoluna lacicola]BDS50977.1 putative lipoprotein YerB [Rhodoluna lacicola]